MPLKLILCRLIPLTALVFSLILSTTKVAAQSKELAYPNRQITLIIPFPPAGATDARRQRIHEPIKSRVLLL